MGIQTVGVVGAGQMGAGIAQVAAASGCDVMLADANLERGSRIGWHPKAFGAGVSKGRLEQAEADAIASRITPVADLEGLSPCDLVVEAVTENEDLKNQIFATLDSVLAPHAILASNTSSIPITRMAAKTSRPERFIGMHFMNPVPVMKLVEVIRGLATSDDTYAAVCALAEKMGKVTVEARDMPGFIVNRILMPMINEAVVTLYHGIGSVEDIDQAMKLGTNQPMGPLTLADFIGLDTCLAIMEVLHEGTGDTKYRPCHYFGNM